MVNIWKKIWANIYFHLRKNIFKTCRFKWPLSSLMLPILPWINVQLSHWSALSENPFLSGSQINILWKFLFSHKGTTYSAHIYWIPHHFTFAFMTNKVAPKCPVFPLSICSCNLSTIFAFVISWMITEDARKLWRNIAFRWIVDRFGYAYCNDLCSFK
jgi:hypothetical protein